LKIMIYLIASMMLNTDFFLELKKNQAATTWTRDLALI